MGAFELFLGYGVVPSMLTVLILLAIGVGRRQLNKVVLQVVNVHLTVNGMQIKLLPLLAFINLTYFFSMLKKIQNLSKQDEVNHEREGHGAHSLYLQELYLSYRNAMMNICSIVLIF